MSWIAMIIIGLVAGALAKAIMPGKDPGGVIVTILLGLVGSFIGGFIGRALFSSGNADSASSPGFLMSILLAVVGAVIVLAVYRLLTGRSLRA